MTNVAKVLGNLRGLIASMNARLPGRLEVQPPRCLAEMTAAALTLDAHMEMLRELRNKADQRGQTSAAIPAEELRGQLNRFYAKQIEPGDAGDFLRMNTEELRAYVYGEKLPPKGETKH